MSLHRADRHLLPGHRQHRRHRAGRLLGRVVRPLPAFAPVFEAASEKHPDIVFGKVDTEAEQELAAAAGIRSIPTLMAFRDGVLVFAQPGALPAAALEELITAVRGLDMERVRAEVAAQAARAPEHAWPGRPFPAGGARRLLDVVRRLPDDQSSAGRATTQ